MLKTCFCSLCIQKALNYTSLIFPVALNHWLIGGRIMSYIPNAHPPTTLSAFLSFNCVSWHHYDKG